MSAGWFGKSAAAAAIADVSAVPCTDTVPDTMPVGGVVGVISENENENEWSIVTQILLVPCSDELTEKSSTGLENVC